MAAAVDGGARFVGFVFYDPSPRNLPFDTAAKLAARVPRSVLRVGVVVDKTDDQLRLIFLCCHPEIPQDGRVALTLKTVCGFSVPEIARAFLAPPSTVAQRLVRAQRRIRELGLPRDRESPAHRLTVGRHDVEAVEHGRVGGVAGGPRRAELAQLDAKAGAGELGGQLVEHATGERLEQVVRLGRTEVDDDLRDLAVVDGVAQAIARAGPIERGLDFHVDLEGTQAAPLGLGCAVAAVEGDPGQDQGGHGWQRPASPPPPRFPCASSA